MKRTNVFTIKFRDDSKALERAKGCSALWNVVNYKRRQSFFTGNIDFAYADEYKRFAPSIGATTAQQIIRKNDKAWKAFFKLHKMMNEGTLPPNIKHVGPPGYWKDRTNNEVIPRMLIRADEYKIKGRTMKLSKKMRARIFGNLKWSGKQGTLEIARDDKDKWHAYMPVETQDISQILGQGQSYVDFGIKYPVTAVIEGQPRPIAYDGAPLLADWWYWNHRIAKCQRDLDRCNGKHTSARLKRLYRKRQKRFRQAINRYIADFVERCQEAKVGEIIAGDLTGIRDTGSKGRKTNTMINNFWSHAYMAERLKCTAENAGIVVKLKDERGTSSRCPWCGSEDVVKRGRLFKCRGCKIEAHRDAVGSINIGLVHGRLSREGDTNRVMTHPEIVSELCSFHTNNLEGTPAL